MVDPPLTLLNNLKGIFDHQRDIFLPKAKHEMLNLRLQDYVRVYN